MDGIDSKHRSRPVEETLALWEHMVLGSEVGVTNCLRFKINMQEPNKAMRDPVAFRCNATHHWRTAHTYKVGLHATRAHPDPSAPRSGSLPLSVADRAGMVPQLSLNHISQSVEHPGQSFSTNLVPNSEQRLPFIEAACVSPHRTFSI